MNRLYIAVLALLLSITHSTFALTFRDVEIVCPIDGKRFTQALAMSGTQFGLMLDLRPTGAIAAPWPLPVCPDNQFVIYRKDFAEDDIAKLRRFVASPEYAALSTETTYYRAARLEALLGGSDELVADLLLNATWQARTPDEYTRYASDALSAHRAVLSRVGGDRNERADRELVAGELERRLGYFREAQARFERLQKTKEFKKGIRADMVRLQLRLIQDKDTSPHQVPDRR